jgi:hypothetical protein
MTRSVSVTAKDTAVLQGIAKALDHGLNGDERPKRVGFTVLLFNFGDEGQVNYVSNADRADMIASMKSLLARWEGQPRQEGRA